MKNISAVLFDLDGTLIDSEYFYFSNWAPILSSSFGVEITFNDWIREFAGHTLLRNVQHLKDRFNVDTTEEFMWNATRTNYGNSDMRTINLMPFAKEILEFLKEKNIRIGLVTSSYLTTVETVLGHHNLLHYFEFFITREQVEQPKPNPEPYLLAIEKLALQKDEIVVLEDTITGTKAALAAGLQCIAVSKHKTERERLMGHADILLESMYEVMEIWNIPNN